MLGVLIVSSPCLPSCRQQLHVLQRGVSTAFRHLKVKLEKEKAGHRVLAHLDQMYKLNKAKMKEARQAGSSALSHDERRAVRRAAERIKNWPSAIKEIEEGLERDLKAKEVEEEEERIDYQLPPGFQQKAGAALESLGSGLGRHFGAKLAPKVPSFLKPLVPITLQVKQGLIQGLATG